MGDTVYCYPNSNELRNRLDITEQSELLQIEADITGERLAELQISPVQGSFDFKHLCTIHRRIFHDLFTWAGKPRTVDIGKGNLFCRVQHIETYAQEVFSTYYRDCVSAQNDQTEFIHRLTSHYADLNALHPFREGNGRAQREFARELCCKCGYLFDLTRTNHEEMLNASIQSFYADNVELERIFSKVVTPNEGHFVILYQH